MNLFFKIRLMDGEIDIPFCGSCAGFHGINKQNEIKAKIRESHANMTCILRVNIVSKADLPTRGDINLMLPGKNYVQIVDYCGLLCCSVA